MSARTVTELGHKLEVYIPDGPAITDRVKRELNDIGTDRTLTYGFGQWEGQEESVSIYTFYTSGIREVKHIVDALFDTQEAVLIVQDGTAWLYER